MFPVRKMAILAGAIAALGMASANGENLFQNFESWPRSVAMGNYTNAGWVINDGTVKGPAGGFFPFAVYDGTNALCLEDYPTRTNAWIRSPFLTNGLGTLAFAAYSSKVASWCGFVIETSTNGIDWNLVDSGMHQGNAYSNYSFAVNDYNSLYVRIRKVNDSATGVWLGLDAISTTNPPARVLISDATTSPEQPLVGKPTDISCNIAPSLLASNITATCFWHVAANPWEAIPMTTNGGNQYKTATPIPPQPVPVTVYYYISAWFQGNDPISPTSAPPEGTSAPYSFPCQPRGYESEFDSLEGLTTVDDFPTNLSLIADYHWNGVYSTTSVIEDAQFRFRSISTNMAVTNFYGDTNQDDNALPIPGRADTNGPAITISGPQTGQFVFRFVETNLEYSVRQCVYQNFSEWTTTDFASVDTNNEWEVYNAFITLDPGRKWRDRACYLDTNGLAAVRAPYLPEGIGEVSFYYRNWDSTGSSTGTVYIQKSFTGGTNEIEWTTVDTIVDLTSTNYGRYSLSLNSRYGNYVRIRNSTMAPCARLCLDEILVAYPGAGLIITNVFVTPDPPAASNTVTISADLLPRAGASNRTATLYYRTGTSGTYTAIGMTNSGGDTFITTNPVPAAKGHEPSGVGTVQYYIEAACSGFESEHGNPTFYPEYGATGPTNYAVIPAQVVFTNLATIPSTPYVNSNIHLSLDVLPVAGAQYLTVRLYYRIGTSGYYTLIPMNPDASNRYTTASPIPAQSHIGTPVQYYVNVEYYGPSAMSPTNYPTAGANGPATFVFRAPPLSSAYTNVGVTGSLSTNLVHVGDYEWQGVVASTNLSGATFRFQGLNAGSTNWGDNNPYSSSLPVFGTADGAAASSIPLSSSPAGNLVFRFNELTGEYSIQRCAYLSFDNWPEPQAGYGNYTNADQWIIGNTRITTNTPSDQARIFLNSSGVMNSNSSPQYIRSPFLSNGVGEISFWYRNWEIDGNPDTEFRVEISSNGVSNWRTVTTVTHVVTMDYLHFSYTLSDRSMFYVRILNATNAPHASLCIDDVIITDPGPYVSFANVSNSPVNPAVVDKVSVFATITPLGGATNLSAVVHYRVGTNGEFETVQMTNVSGTLYQTIPPIPSGPIGTMQYYVECFFSGMRSAETVSIRFPADAPFNIRAYTNTDSSLFQDFETWPRAASYGNYTSDNWVVNDGRIRGAAGGFFPFSVKSGTNACAFDDYDTAYSNGWLRSPLLSNGVGEVSFWVSTPKGPSLNYFSLEACTNTEMVSDESAWFDLGFSSVDNSSAYTLYSHFVDQFIDIPVYLRIRKTGDSAVGMFMGLEDVSISCPPAKVQISDTMIHPGYPSSNDPVYVSCTITSTTPRFPAIGITARVYYRQGAGGFTNWIDMTRVGSYYITASPIPAYGDQSRVDYYIESRFLGYAHDPSESHSPTFLPAGTPGGATNQYFDPPSTYFSYQVRAFESDYNDVVVFVDTTNVTTTLLQADHDQWQGVVKFKEPVVDPTFVFRGLEHYDGTNYVLDSTNAWGDAYQYRTRPPYSGDAQLSGPSVILSGTNLGQYVFRFNERDLSYSVQKCVFQDFDTWPASSTFFDESISKDDIQIFSQPYTNWALSAALTHLENFSSWTITNEFQTGKWAGGQNFWVVYDSLVTRSLDINYNEVCQFLDSYPPAYGIARPNAFSLVDGLGSISFLYRVVDTNIYPTFYSTGSDWSNSMVEISVQPTQIATNNGVPSLRMGMWWAGVYSRYQNPNNFYEASVRQHPTHPDYRKLYVRRRRTGYADQWWGGWDLYFGPLNRLEPSVVKFNVATYWGSRVYWEVYHNGTRYGQAWDNGGGQVSGPGSIGIAYSGADVKVNSIAGGWAQQEAFNDWSATDTTISTNAGWISHFAYIPNNYCRLATNVASRPVKANLRSPLLPHGIGQVRFRCYRDSSSGDIPVMRIQHSPNGETNSVWTDLFATNISNTSFLSLTLNFDVTNSVYMRILNDTNTTGRHEELFLDDVVIEPNTARYYAEDFSDNLAQGWSDTNVYWLVTNQAYTAKAYNHDPLSVRIETASYASDLEDNGSWTTWTTITNIQNLMYLTTSYVFEQADSLCVRVKHSAGRGSLVVDDLRITGWHATNLWGTAGWYAEQGWVVTNGVSGSSDRCIELRRSRALSGTDQYVRSPYLTNGMGVISFYSRCLNSTPVTWKLQVTVDTNYSWTTLLTGTNTSTNWLSGYVSHSAQLQPTANKHYVRILHTTTNADAGLLVDDFTVTDFAERDEYTWVGYNALITPNQTALLRQTGYNVKGAYLNHDDDADTGGRAFRLFRPYIQSAYLDEGIGEIAFWYRNWGTPHPASTLYIMAGSSPTSPPSEWTTLTTLSNVTDSTFQYFTYSVYDTSNHYVRVATDTNAPAGRFCLDDMLVTTPYGADVQLRNLLTDPAVPLDTNDVHITVELFDFFLQPMITNVMAYYLVGTNPWSSWTGEGIPMSMIDSSPQSRTYRTDYPIPAQDIDEVVQYYVRCDFLGRFYEKASPKLHKDFDNPGWYYPVDLNRFQPNRCPYYIVFSCLPGEVWINEFNYYYTMWWSDINEYVEISGRSGIDVKNWRIELVNTSTSVYDYCVITNQVIPYDDTNTGFGFLVFGDPEVNPEYAFTNPVAGNLYQNGGIRLVRSCGAYESRICYGPTFAAIQMTNGGFEYVGYILSDINATPINLAGIGNVYSNFAWTNVESFDYPFYYTPGAVNVDQTLVGTYNPPPDEVSISIAISKFWLAANTNWIVFNVTGTDTVDSAVWFATNLANAQWYSIPTASTPRVGAMGVYTQWFTLMTNAPSYFYRIGATNAP